MHTQCNKEPPFRVRTRECCGTCAYDELIPVGRFVHTGIKSKHIILVDVVDVACGGVSPIHTHTHTRAPKLISWRAARVCRFVMTARVCWFLAHSVLVYINDAVFLWWCL